MFCKALCQIKLSLPNHRKRLNTYGLLFFLKSSALDVVMQAKLDISFFYDPNLKKKVRWWRTMPVFVRFVNTVQNFLELR